MNIATTLRVAAAGTLFALSLAAVAQTPPPAPPTAAAPAVPPPDCVSPGDLPTSSRPGMNTMENFQKKVDAYGVCMKAYVAQQRTAAEDAIAKAKAHQDAANAMVSKYNDYVNALNEQAAKKNN